MEDAIDEGDEKVVTERARVAQKEEVKYEDLPRQNQMLINSAYRKILAFNI